MSTSTEHAATGAHERATISTDGAEMVITRTFPGTAELVFEAMTNPEHIRKWWGAGHGTMTVCEVDLREGGAWHFAQTAGSTGDEVSFSGHYKQIDRPGHLVHTERFDNIDSPYSVIDTTYVESDGKTVLTATITYDSPETVQMVLDSGMESGMQASYDAIDDVLAELSA
jgi:uncharacterized protein YndB with AHSA1/START domain